MKLNGSEQLDIGVLAKIVADEFGTGEITEKEKRKHNRNFRAVNRQVASKVFLNS